MANNSTSSQIQSHPNANITKLREIYSFLEEPVIKLNLPPGAGPYDKIVAMIRQLDIEDDGIAMNQKIKSIEIDFCTIVKDENMLCESMNYINEKALQDGEIALKFALLFSSRNFDALAMKETKVRSAMLKILETNFLNADTFRVHDKDRLYNSITLLGEYYNRVRLADNSPITILGESLIGLLMREIEGKDVIDSKLAKLILSQMTLNGDIMRARHQRDLTQLLFHIRRNLVEQTILSSTVKALLLMTLDLYYRNFKNLGPELENFYMKYLANEEQENRGNNNNQKWSLQNQKQKDQQIDKNSTIHNISQEQETVTDANNDSFEIQPSTKKWSEQVCEDSMYDNEPLPDYENNSPVSNDQLNSNNIDHKVHLKHEKDFRNNRRSYGPRSLRPLKQSPNEKQGSQEYLSHSSSQGVNGEEADQTKPLPRWRATRFNREEDQHNENSRNRYRRFSGSFDEDHQSVCSESGSIRLYSINDRLKHSQEKMERSNNNYSFIVNSNWDRQSQRDDRSERSYISNYEYGNKQRRGYRNYNNRQNYDKPPRFQKNRKQQQEQQQQQKQQQQQPQPQQPQQQQQQQNHDDQHTKIYSENWRRNRRNSNNSFHEDFDEARASTLPRPAKGNFDGSIKSASFRRSQSPTHQRDFHRNQQQRGMHRNYNGRYSSQTSIHSEEGNLPEQRSNSHQQQQQQQQQHHHRQHHNFFNRGGRRPSLNPRKQQAQQPEDDKSEIWIANNQQSEEGQKENNELVRNARQTTEYMNYLSSKK